MTDLEQLSREAAKVLPNDVCDDFHGDGYILADDGVAQWKEWLHESTEACAEIMVRVLLADGWELTSDVCPSTVILTRWHESREQCVEVEKGQDPMQAFRTAVLRALIEVKK